MCSQSLRISQGFSEFGKVANLARWFAKLAKWFANLAKWFANLAMRNFAKLLKFYVRSEVRNVLCNMASEFRNGCELVANSLPISQWLPTGCQQAAKISALLFFNSCSKICTKLLKLMQEKLHKSKN